MTSLRRTLPLLPLLLTPLASTAYAQVPVARWDSPDESGFSNDPFYRQLSDIDGDGFPEILFPHAPGVTGSPDLWAYSMVRQVPLFTISTNSLNGTFQDFSLLSTADLNGDGLRDIVSWFAVDAPMPPTPRPVVRAFSGADGTLLWEQDSVTAGFEFGGISNVGDINGDGIEDVSSLTPPPTADKIVVFSGVDGAVLLMSSPVGALLSTHMQPAGDIDQDGYGDVVARFGLCSEFGIFSGRTGQMLVLRPRRTGDGRTREYVVGVGDANGDGLDDWAEGWNGDNPNGTGICKQSVIKVFTGLQATEIGTIEGLGFPDSLYEGPYFHDDFDGDGSQDIVFCGRNGSANNCRPVTGPFYTAIASLTQGKIRWWPHDGLVPWAVDEDWDGDVTPDLLAYKTFFGANPGVQSLVAYSLGPHLGVSANSLSQSAGGTLDFQINAGTRFAGRRAFLLLSAAGPWPAWTKTYRTPNGTAQELALPFVPGHLTGTLWALSGTPKGARYSTTLDAAGHGTVTLAFAPGEIPAPWIGRKVRFTAVLDSDDPGFPESATEAAVVVVTP